MSKTRKGMLLVILGAIIGGLGFLLLAKSVELSKNIDNGVACTMEAKLCPDGSTVGRVGPKCQFASCPIDTSSWKTTTDKQTKVSFKYPPTLSTSFINTVDWPPKVQVTGGPFSCTEGGSPNAPAGQTLEKVISGRTYCVTEESQGAAGSIYTMYAYAFAKSSKVPILTFSLRFPQCGNYPQPNMSACQKELQDFDIDRIVDQIAQTLTLPVSTSLSQSGIKGTASLGPICPVMRNPPDPKCADKAYSGKFNVTKAGDPAVIAQFSSNENGVFSVSLKPGFYDIQPAGNQMLPRCSSLEMIKVVESAYTEAKIFCDTGIR